jgi:Trk-type K+ transport system membrane component
MTIRTTNPLEERSLGLYAEDIQRMQESESIGKKDRGLLNGLKRTMTMTHGQGAPMKSSASWTREDFVRQQLRGQLGHDLWLIALAVFMITAIETGQFERDPVVFSTFNIIFEVISAYGCVGISTGVPWNAYSFCGAWHTASKLVLCVVMIRGRHRGLPVSVDRAVLLPDESLAWAEEEDAHKRASSFTTTSGIQVPSRDNLVMRPRTASTGAPGPSIANARDAGDLV